MGEVGFGAGNSSGNSGKKPRKRGKAGPTDGRRKNKGRAENLIKWKPGESGNPKGRPKKTALDLALASLLEEDVQNVVGQRGKMVVTGDLTVAEALARGFVQHALKGSAKYGQLVAERTGGKPSENIHVKHSGDVAFTVRHIGAGKADAGNSSTT